MPPTRIHIAGAGPAGSCAALAALAEGVAVRIYERSSLPRHKVCGEFLSPEIRHQLELFGLGDAFESSRPAAIRRVRLHFGSYEKRWALPEAASGLSRFSLDQLLCAAAAARGAEVVHEDFRPSGEPSILAFGRKGAAARGHRIFGFKAHFTGPADDAVELFFSSKRLYAGVSSVENGVTNVCGLAPESLLAGYGFDIDRLLAGWPAVRERIAPLSRTMEWLTTGPLVFGANFDSARDNEYRTGDALGFVDPFTGSGILSAIVTGKMAGKAAAAGLGSSVYLRQCAKLLRRQYLISKAARFAIFHGLADEVARLIPGRFLFNMTRPQLRVLK